MNEQDWMSAVAGAREEGLEQGLVQQQLASLKRMLTKGYSEKEIQDILMLSQEELSALKQQL